MVKSIMLMVLLVFSPIAFSAAQNVPVVDVSNLQGHIKTNNDYHYIKDASQQLTLEDVLAQHNWLASTGKIHNRGMDKDVSWMRFVLQNRSGLEKKLIIAYVDPAVSRIDFHSRLKNSSQAFELQSFLYAAPAELREVSFHRPAFHLSLAPNSEKEVVIRIMPGNQFPMHSFTAFDIWSEREFYRHSDKELTFLTILFSTELFMAFITLLLYFVSKEKLFLFYSAFALAAFFMFVSASGILPYWLSHSSYQLWMVVLKINICQITAILFIRFFLETAKNMPITDKLLLTVIAIDVVGVVLNVLGYPYFSRVIIDYTAIGYFLLIPIGIYSYFKKVPNSLLFMFSWIIFLIGMVLASMRLRGYIADTPISLWMIYVGGFIEIFLLLTILVLRIRHMQKARIEAETLYRTNLEHTADVLNQKVKEQTKLLEQAKNKAEKEARIDILTGLTNRRAFIEQANQSIARSKRNMAKKLYLFMIDVDHFKQVNDNFGHAAGDAVLSEVSKILSNEVREIDLVSRIGGEEFALMLECSDTEEADELANRLRTLVNQQAVSYEGQPIRISISVGYAYWRDNLSLDQLMSLADTALYQAKNNGRNCVVAANQEIDDLLLD